MKRILLSEIKEGEWARIVSLNNESMMKRRLMELGFIPGTDVVCTIGRKKGMQAYGVCGAVIALRHKDAAEIEVELLL